jgi:acyl-CoA synthetase (AMP-forming)/AMP-acid ligase II
MICGLNPRHRRTPLLEADPQDDMIQLYTSGTTGFPKGVQLTNRNYLAAFEQAAASGKLNYEPGDTVLAAMPFFHVAGVNIALIAMASGARSAILRDAAPQLILDVIGKERVSHAFLAPALIHMLMQAPGIESADLSSMTVLSYGASPISEDLLKARGPSSPARIMIPGRVSCAPAASPWRASNSRSSPPTVRKSRKARSGKW